MKKKIIKEESIPEFEASIASISDESKIFVDKSLEIADYIFHVMQQREMKQKQLAEKMGKTEAEVSKLLAGMHNYTLRSLAKIEAALGTTIIYTPKHSRTSLSVVKMRKSDYEVVEKKESFPKKNIQYSKIVQLFKPYKQEEAAAI